MNMGDASAYLGLGSARGKAVLDRLPSFQHIGSTAASGGDRYWTRKTLDAYIAWRMGEGPSPLK